MTTRVMFYVQHLLGIGHLARASLISAALERAGMDVTMVMGGAPVPGFPEPGIKVEQLPVLKAGRLRFNDLTDEHDVVVDADYLNARRDRLLAFFDTYEPDVLIIEAFPFGRRQMRFELVPLLERAKARAAPPLVACSVRDIVQENRKPGRAQETITAVNDWFDVVLVHGDPDFCAFDQSFPHARQIVDKITYTGIVAGDIPALAGPSCDVVISAGGGAAGESLMLAAAAARAQSALRDAKWCFLTGANLNRDAVTKVRQLAGADASVEPCRTDFRAVLANCMVSVSQAGYNTTADLMKAMCPAVLVPFASGGETEQSRRADRLRELGLARVISENNLSPVRLAQEIDKAVQADEKKQSRIDVGGANATARLIAGLKNRERERN